MVFSFWCASLFVLILILDESTIELRLKIKCTMCLLTAQACRSFRMPGYDRLLFQFTPDGWLLFDVVVCVPSIIWGVFRSTESRRYLVGDSNRT